MLTVRVSTNLRRKIEDIFIHNTGEVVNGMDVYELIDPVTNEELIKNVRILHKRDDGYRPLLIKVLELLEKEDIETRKMVGR